METTILTYTHTRNIFSGDDFKPFVKKFFKDFEFLGATGGRYYPRLKVSNYEEVKDLLPKYARPIEVSND